MYAYPVPKATLSIEVSCPREQSPLSGLLELCQEV